MRNLFSVYPIPANVRKPQRKAIFLSFLILPIWGAFAEEPRFYIDLQDYPLYLKAGFDPADTAAPNVQDPAWRAYPRWSHVLISKLNLPGNPKRRFLSPFGKAPQEWTFFIPFRLEENTPEFPGIFLAAIGENWEIYLNGTPIRREMHLDESGKIRERRSQREVFFPIDRRALWPGENLLVFRIVGDPTDQTVGFQYAGPYYLADYEYIARKNSEILEFVLIGVFLLVGIYHFLIFAVHRKSRYNGFCGAFALLMGLYYLTRTREIYRLIPDTLLAVKLEFFFIFLIIPVLAFFTGLLGRGRIPVPAKIYGGLCAFLAGSQLLFPHPYGSDALFLWQIAGIFAILWMFIYNILLPFVEEVKKGRGIKAAIWDTYPGNMLIAMGVLAASIIVDLGDALIFHYSIGFTRYSMVLFVLSLAVMLARLYYG
ncbi:MAG: 7TM-DISM domain-containing protein, partial [Spirochaetaceae bacterium]|nr:7TM-DISM domain-containing protein [Spirochaetaceae bacterium]